MATITFGKYSGTTTSELKSIDPEYLRWGATNLRSDYWKNEFRKAVAEITSEDEARAIAKHDDISFSAALSYIREVTADEAETDRRLATAKAAEDAVLAKWAGIMGKSVGDLRSIRNKFLNDWNEVPANRFSSQAAYNNFRQMMKEADEAGESAWKHS